MSLKVECDSAIGLAIYGFLLMVNSNIGPNSAALPDITFRNASDFDKALKVKSDGVIGATYGFLLMGNSNIGPNPTPLRDIRH